MKNVIITGANGFMGHNLAKKLIQQGVRVYALDLPDCSDKLETHDLIHFIPVKFEKMDDVIYRLRNISFDAIYHFAWTGVGTHHKNNYKIQLRNIETVLQCIELAQNIGCDKVICSGSVSEYAYCGEVVNGQNTPAPSDMYAACKVAAHYISQIYAEQKKVGLIWLLISSVYGPGRDDNNIITYSIKKLLSGETPLYTKLEQIWDYIYIDDLLEALFLIGQYGVLGSTYAVGSGQAKRLRDYVLIIRDAINPRLSLGIGELPYKTKDIDNSIVDISLLQKHTGFVPKYTFEEGVTKMIEYYKTKGNTQGIV